MKLFFASVFFILSVLSFQQSADVTDKIVCYYGSWATYRQGRGQFNAEHIDPRLCSHLVYTFVGLNQNGTVRILENLGKGPFIKFNSLKAQNPNLKTIIAIGGWNEDSKSFSKVMADDTLRARFVKDATDFTIKHGFDGFDLDWIYPNQRGGKPEDVVSPFIKFNSLKAQNPNLKTIIAIGGWNDDSKSFSKVMADDTLRARFVKDATDFTIKHGFDGFDLDWIYPNQRGGKPEDVENLSKVLKELRTEFDKHGLLLSMAVAAPQYSASQSYHIPALSQYLDIINVMAFDLHGTWDKAVGQNAPLFASSADVTEFKKQLNIESCINYWLSEGADPSKIVLGIEFYGRTFTLIDVKNKSIGAPSDNPGNSGLYTNQQGILGYNEILELQGKGGWTVVWNKEQQVPHMFKGNQWVGYDNPASIRLKVQWAKEKGLGGVMAWSIETDDFHGVSGSKFPLLHAMNYVIGNDVSTEKHTTPPLTTTPTPGEGGNGNSFCKTEGYVRDENDCAKFYICVRKDNGLRPVPFKCAKGLMFDTDTNTCNYPWNVIC